MRQIKISKGRFVVTDDKKETHYPFHVYIQLYGDNYYKLSEITEEEASSIVQQSIHTKLYAHYVKDIEVNTFCYESAIESIHSLLESQGIEITNNTYIFKV